MSENVLTVFLYASLTAVATGFGALPFLLFRNISRQWLGYSNAVAAGLMLTASFTLIFEGLHYGLWKTVLGVLIGLVFIIISNHWLQNHEDMTVADLKGADARKAILIVGVMTLHSFTEGVGVGVSFGGDAGLGVFITAAIALHNIPEGLAISLVLIPRGMRVLTAAGLAVLSSVPQPIMAVPAFLFVEFFRPVLPVGLGFAAGAMIWMVFSEIMPETREETTSNKVGITITLSVILMIVLQEFVR